jgi:hypothetical protein
MATQSERLSALEQRVADHEARCEERLAEIRAAAGSTLRAVEGLKNRSWGVVLALLAWALAQVWSATTTSAVSARSANPAAAAREMERPPEVSKIYSA